MLPEAVAHLAGAYFHQDHDLEYDSPTEALEDYRDVHPADAVGALRVAIQGLLTSGTSEKELADLWLDEGGACYDPRDDGISVTDWFHTMLAALDR
ncbi:contact-dependent growth inhibition system immunity protein [Streptomyces sp. NPDC029006]|uniref:contact-dependent growth inhibition system immunity protein n=1 Tax=Streptomyces sp. NPDC029006 TaxID=3155467 RepID=UPI0033D4EF98